MIRFVREIGEVARRVPARRRALGLVAGSVAVGLVVLGLASATTTLRAAQAPRALNDTGVVVSPVVGPSWLAVQRLDLRNTAMGDTFAFGPPPPAGESPIVPPPPTIRLVLNKVGQTFTMTGSDLYRLNCEGCHGPKGEGVPPEINSLIGPVQGASLQMTMARLKQTGASVPASFAESLVKTGQATLHDRLVNGGKKMPPFRRLSPDEVKALEAYLDLLAGVPGAQARQMTIEEPYQRVGELLVKGTCHICHDATGPGKNPQLQLEGIRPSLASLVRDDSMALFVQKVVHGAPILMGTPAFLRRGDMPVFYYLSQDEAAAAYYYLLRYTPQARPFQETAVAAYAH
ncbi:MAG TPA: cytochrome c [Vicinamibacterales bacterium]|nr:cytochrome c [Vicinamibacterales bacterium]